MSSHESYADSGYVRRDDLTPRDCGWPGPRSDGGWRYHCFRPVGHDGLHEAMAAAGESIPQTAAGTVRWGDAASEVE